MVRVANKFLRGWELAFLLDFFGPIGLGKSLNRSNVRSSCASEESALSCHPFAPEWRNWYTHQTQNLARFTPHVGSSPTSGTSNLRIQNMGQNGADGLLRKGLERAGSQDRELATLYQYFR